ncbi:MAG: M20/M25/M40 family metallo-hydrolase [Isosphaeraceae bacterium]
MRLRFWVACVVAIGLSGLSLAGAGDKDSAKVKRPEFERIVSAGHEDSQVMDHLDWLCNRIGPRLTGSDNLTNACEWVRDRFASFGIDNARLEPWGEFPVGFNRGPWFGRVIQPEPKALEFMTKAWSAGTKGAVRGKAVLAPKDQKELDLAKANGTIAGAWVLLPRPARSGPRPDPAFLRSLRKELEAAKPAGIVVPSSSDLLVTSGVHRISWDKLPTVPAVTLLRKQFEEIAAWLKEGKTVTLEFDIRNYFKKGPVKLYNVIADIPGSELPDEYVIVGGHIDSWDGATGATDNGTGVATTLEAARILTKSGVKPKRTIRFMVWSGEEQGLLGSAAYVKAHKDLTPKISAVLVHDGGTNYLSGIGATDAIVSDFEQVFTPIKKLDAKYPFEVRKVPGLFGGGSDHASFLEANVPGFFWRQAGDARYQRTHHTQYDTFDAAIPDYQKHSSLVIALAAYGIANLDHLLSREKLRVPGSMANRRTLGVQLDEMTVVEVEADSAGQKGGMKEGDEILKIDATKVADRMELGRALRAGGPKKVVTVRRGGKEVELNLSWEAPAVEKSKQ